MKKSVVNLRVIFHMKGSKRLSPFIEQTRHLTENA